jgi:hypothetical protein
LDVSVHDKETGRWKNVTKKIQKEHSTLLRKKPQLATKPFILLA